MNKTVAVDTIVAYIVLRAKEENLVGKFDNIDKGQWGKHFITRCLYEARNSAPASLLYEAAMANPSHQSIRRALRVAFATTNTHTNDV